MIRFAESKNSRYAYHTVLRRTLIKIMVKTADLTVVQMTRVAAEDFRVKLVKRGSFTRSGLRPPCTDVSSKWSRTYCIPSVKPLLVQEQCQKTLEKCATLEKHGLRKTN